MDETNMRESSTGQSLQLQLSDGQEESLCFLPLREFRPGINIRPE